MDIKMKWFYRLGFLLLLFIVIFVFLKLEPFWQPLLSVFLSASFPFIIGGFIAYLLHPLVDKLHQNGLKRWLSVLIIYILFFGIIGFFIYKGTPIFIQQLRDLTENVPVFLRQLQDLAEKVQAQTQNWPFKVDEYIDEALMAIDTGINRFAEKVFAFILWLFDTFIIIVLIPFIAFYMIKDLDYINQVFWSFVPSKWREQTREFIEKVDHQLGSYIRGQLLVCSLIGIVSIFAFWLIGIRYPLLLGSIIGITNVIPYFGPIIGAIPAIVVALTISVKKAIFVALIVFGLQFLESNVLSPVIIGKNLKMHPLMIIFSILIGGEMGGVLGLIIAVPVVAIVKTAIQLAVIQIQKNKQRVPD